MKNFFKILKVPIKVATSGSICVFIYNRRYKIYEMVFNSSVKYNATKLLSTGKKTIAIGIFVITFSSIREIENEKIIESSYHAHHNNKIERLSLRGGANEDPIWSPKYKYQSTKSQNKVKNSSKSKSNKLSTSSSSKKRHRRLLLVNENYPFKDKLPYGKSYNLNGKTYTSLEDNNPKKGMRLRVRSMAKTNDDGETEIIRFDQNEKLNEETNKPAVLKDTDSSDNLSINPNEVEELSQEPTVEKANENSKVKNSGLTQARKEVTVIDNDNTIIMPEGDFTNPSRLSLEGKKFIERTKCRRSSELIQSMFEDEEKEFFPVYAPKQCVGKDKHTPEILDKLKKNIQKYEQLPAEKKPSIHIYIVEKLLSHPDTEIHTNVMAQGREPVVVALNRGKGSYPIENHIATFERRDEIWKLNPYITNYFLMPYQVENFDQSANTEINFEDIFGNSKVNIGPIIGDDMSDNITFSPTIETGNNGPRINTPAPTINMDDLNAQINMDNSNTPAPTINNVESDISEL